MIENISPKPSGVQKIDKRMVISIVLFICMLVLIILYLMTLADKKASESRSVSQTPTAHISHKKTNVKEIDELPDDYSKMKPERVNDLSKASQEEKSPPPAPPDKNSFFKQQNQPVISQPERQQSPPQKKYSTQAYLPSAKGEDIRPGATYQHRSPKEIQMEQARQSQILFFGTGQDKKKTKQPENMVQTSNPGLEKQAMINDLIDRVYPGRETSETRINQQTKKAFFQEQAQSNEGAIYLNQRIQDPVSPYQIMAGTVLPAVLISGINSDLPGHIIAQIRENVFDTVHGRYLLVPQGTKLLGSYDNMVSWGQDKVMLVWSRLIMPDGATIVLDNMPGVDTMGYSGLKDKVNNHYMKIAGAILMSTFLSVGTRRVAGEVRDNDPTLAQELAADASIDINRAGQKIVSRHMNVPPTLEIRPGFPFNVMVNKDIILRPYGNGN